MKVIKQSFRGQQTDPRDKEGELLGARHAPCTTPMVDGEKYPRSWTTEAALAHGMSGDYPGTSGQPTGQE